MFLNKFTFGRTSYYYTSSPEMAALAKNQADPRRRQKRKKKKKKKVALCGQITVANCPMETAGGQGSVSKFSHISPKIDIAEQAPPNEERREKGKTDMPRRSKAVTSWEIASLKRG